MAKTFSASNITKGDVDKLVQAAIDGSPAFGDDEVCRKYDLVAQGPENFSQSSGVACRQSNGNWLLNA